MEEIPMGEYLEAWRAAGVGVTLCLSRSWENKGRLEGVHLGYVQEAAVKDCKTKQIRAHRSMVLMCGAKRMQEDAREVLGVAGVPSHHFVTNF